MKNSFLQLNLANAVGAGQLEEVKQLLCKGVSICAPFKSNTFLDLAIMNKHKDLIIYLMEELQHHFTLPLNIRNGHGNTPLQTAEEVG